MNPIAILAQNEIRTFYELMPMVPLTQWWHLLLAILVAIILIGYIVLMYRADSRELPSGLTFLLSALRIFAFCTLVLFILNPEKRSETRIVKTSRVSVLVDTSLSMGLRDPNESGEPNPDRRIDEVIKTLSKNTVIEELRKEHDVTVYRFDEKPQPEVLASYARVKVEETPTDRNSQLNAQAKNEFEFARRIGWIGLAILGLSLFLGVVYLIVRMKGMPTISSWMLAASLLTLLAAVATVGFAHCAASDYGLLSILSMKEPEAVKSEFASPTEIGESEGAEKEEKVAVNWKKELNPRGTATRLGQAIQYVVNKERGGPIAGIIVITDGRDNDNAPTTRAIAASADANIPVYTVGIGSDKQPKNVRVDDLQAQPRVFPGDKFKIKGVIQAVGLAGQTVNLKLVSTDEQGKQPEEIEVESQLRLGTDGQLSPVEFELSREEQGKRRYTLRVEALKQDLDPRDNERSTVIEIIERKTNVLIMAGGPAREFRFLRNQLFRDETVSLSVWLQSAQEGADQESDQLLTDFPDKREDLYEYDCIIAFDPDWRELTEQQASLLEKWVAEQAGGLIVIAGPVFTPEWTRRPRGDSAIDLIRRLYPVSFFSQASPTLKLGRFGGEQPFPIQFTREGRAANFLWLGESAIQSQENWDTFEGIFGYYAVNEQKAGADVLGRFSDPETAIDDELPIYIATQYYGSGRVFFQGSGEMWRIRNIDVKYFVDYYTQIIRWAGQGRLSRDSSRGVLLAEKQQCWVGDQVVIRAILRDAQDQPLMKNEISAVVKKPDGSTETLSLKAAKDSVRAGTFTGQFSALADGDFRVSLPVPDSAEGDILVTTVEAKIPDLEKARPQRNDALLKEFADKTSGQYFIGMSELDRNPDDPESVYELAGPQDQVTFLPGTPSQEFTRRVMIWLLVLITLALAMEWTTRRLNKLA